MLDQLAPGSRRRGSSATAWAATSRACMRACGRERVRCVVNLEGFGLPRTSPERAPARIRSGWIRSRRFRSCKNLRLVRGARRGHPASLSAISAPRARDSWPALGVRLEADGRVHLLGDARHRWVNPVLYKREEAEAVWRGIRAPLLMLLGEQSEYLAQLGPDGTDEAWRGARARHRDRAHRRARDTCCTSNDRRRSRPLIERFLDDSSS